MVNLPKVPYEASSKSMNLNSFIPQKIPIIRLMTPYEIFKLLEGAGLLRGNSSRIANLFCDMEYHIKEEFIKMDILNYETIFVEINTLLAEEGFSLRIKKHIEKYDEELQAEKYVLVDLETNDTNRYNQRRFENNDKRTST